MNPLEPIRDAENTPKGIVPEYLAEKIDHPGEGDKPPVRKMSDMDVYEALNWVAWHLAEAVGDVTPEDIDYDFEWDELLARALHLIELGLRYEDMADS